MISMDLYALSALISTIEQRLVREAMPDQPKELSSANTSFVKQPVD